MFCLLVYLEQPSGLVTREACAMELGIQPRCSDVAEKLPTLYGAVSRCAFIQVWDVGWKVIFS